ncbi:DUF427 domain-containing protein [Porifericola rhodea]|uniref:DUF427 domain-containing protein n=1 Tax=Porifericola rhodea TaxID=930972 RepID=UPI002664FBA1|nr:DUF427 domain-containing protein [Porifericola rhodea]WKN29658.1 DUF427 domain-containing protein [Porifericola rhodea]
MKAIFNGQVIAESDQTEVVEGNHYFPQSSIQQEAFKKSNTHTTCPWKGKASYYHIEVEGKEAKDAAWYYPEPKEKAQHIKSYVAFYSNKVQITD